jgi:hypothetical protein
MPALICFGVLVPAGLILKADDSENQTVISFRGKANWAMATMASPVIRQTDPNPAKFATIFSNLGGNGDLYEKNVSWDVAGPDSVVPQQWVAMPFTPAFDAEVTRIVVAVEHTTGSPNSFVLSLNADGGGLVPGNVIHGWIVKRAPQFGTCCTLDVANDVRGVKVHKGTQYWIVAQTNEDEQGTRMEWDLSPMGIEGNFALNDGTGWSEFTAFTSAFAVYGKRRESDPRR